jgi:hypothetical protein
MAIPDRQGPCHLLEPPIFTHPGHPLVDDNSAVLIDQATVELTPLRSPTALGDGPAHLNAMVSLLAQLRLDPHRRRQRLLATPLLGRDRGPARRDLRHRQAPSPRPAHRPWSCPPRRRHCGRPGSSGFTTTTGHLAWWTQAEDTDPSSTLASPPRPRLPTTTRRASPDASIRA